MPGPETLAALSGAAALAGWVDAVGGGGGLIQLPALLVLLPGAAPAQVLATNKLSGVCGTAVAAATYARRLRPDPRTVVPMVVAALLGSAGGAASAALVPGTVFRPLVLVLVVAVGAYTLLRPSLGAVQSLRFAGVRHVAVAAAVGVVIGFYDGIFGPGTGTFLTVALVSVLGYAFLQAAATARIVNLATNLGALAVFVAQGAPMYRVGLLMAACNVVGGRLGALTAIRRGSGFVRLVLLVVLGILVVRIAWDLV